MTLTPAQFEAGLEIFRALVQAPDSALADELQASRSTFFGAPAPEIQDDPDGIAAERRLLEWFLFEHAREGSPLLVVDEILELWAELATGELRAGVSAYLESQTGIFEVTAASASGPITLRELAGLASVELAEAKLDSVFEVGDLIVGRLFPVEEGRYHVSPGAGVFRDPRLLQALEVDLGRLREQRAHAVMRLSQLELEAMFWPRSAVEAEAGGDVVGELEEFLRAGGIAPTLIANWIECLRRAPFDAQSLVPGSDGALAAILEIVAFETDLELDRARALFMAAWPALKAQPSQEKPGESEASDIATAMAEFDRDRAAGLDVETSFRELERKLGLDDDEEDGEDEVPDFPGVVGAMIEEFLWETRTVAGEQQSAAHEGLRLFAGYARNIGVFENLSPRDLLAFAAFWLPESRQLKSGAEAERLMRALSAFGRWVVETHGVEVLEDEFEQHLEGLRVSLPRSVVANALLPRVRDAEGELFTFLGGAGQGLGRIRSMADVEREVPLDERLSQLLQEGDLFRGYTRDDGSFAVACCYPPEAAGLRQMKS